MGLTLELVFLQAITLELLAHVNQTLTLLVGELVLKLVNELFLLISLCPSLVKLILSFSEFRSDLIVVIFELCILI